MVAQICNLQDDASDPMKEAYNVLRTNIQFIGMDSSLKVITVTSYKPGEGKTTTAVNLGISMARAGMNVLFVDADLRKPMLIKKLASSNFKGLANYLLGYSTLEEIIVGTNIDGFSFIPSGIKTLNSTGLLNSSRFSEFLKTVREMFDVIIIDTPPLGSVIDCAVIAAKTDGTLIVIETGKVKLKNVQMMKDQLENARAVILGAVLNKVSRSEYKGYYTGYDYYGSSKKYSKGWLHKLQIGKRV